MLDIEPKLIIVMLQFSANTSRPTRTEALENRRLQILSLHRGKRSLRFLLNEDRLRDCGLVGLNEHTDDGFNKYIDWKDVPVPKSYLSPSSEPALLGSPVKTPERTQSEHEGILDRMYSMYSPTLLDTRRDRLIFFPRNPDHSFYVWRNPDRIVHRNDAGLKRWQIMYSCYEIYEGYMNQYGSNCSLDLSQLTSNVEEFPSALNNFEPGLGFPIHPELENGSPFRQSHLS